MQIQERKYCSKLPSSSHHTYLFPKFWNVCSNVENNQTIEFNYLVDINLHSTMFCVIPPSNTTNSFNNVATNTLTANELDFKQAKLCSSFAFICINYKSSIFAQSSKIIEQISSVLNQFRFIMRIHGITELLTLGWFQQALLMCILKGWVTGQRKWWLYRVPSGTLSSPNGFIMGVE